MKTKIQDDVKQAMRARDELRVGALRMLLAALANKEKEKEQHELSEEEIQQVLRKEIKKRKQAAEAFEKGGRQEMAEKEKRELEILQVYLPVG